LFIIKERKTTIKPTFFTVYRNIYQQEPGLKNEIFEELKEIGKNYQEHERFVVLSLDEMKGTFFKYSLNTLKILHYLKIVKQKISRSLSAMSCKTLSLSAQLRMQ